MSFCITEEDLLQNRDIHKYMLEYVYENRNEGMPIHQTSLWWCFRYDDRYRYMFHLNFPLKHIRLLFINVILKNAADYIDDEEKLQYFRSFFVEQKIPNDNLQLPSSEPLELRIISSAQMRTKFERAKVLNLKRSTHIPSCHLSWSYNLATPDERIHGILHSKPEIRKRVLECRAKTRTYHQVDKKLHAKQLLIAYKKAIKRNPQQILTRMDQPPNISTSALSSQSMISEQPSTLSSLYAPQRFSEVPSNSYRRNAVTSTPLSSETVTRLPILTETRMDQPPNIILPSASTSVLSPQTMISEQPSTSLSLFAPQRFLEVPSTSYGRNVVTSTPLSSEPVQRLPETVTRLPEPVQLVPEPAPRIPETVSPVDEFLPS